MGRGGQFAAAPRIPPAEIVPTEQTSREYDPYMAGTTEDPYTEYRWLRDEHPLYFSERYGIYAVSRYEDVAPVSRDWETFTSAQGVDVDDTALLGGPNVLETDPPEHHLVAPAVPAPLRREGDPRRTDPGDRGGGEAPPRPRPRG